MGMFIVLLGVFAIILTATCSAFGITLPEPKPEARENDNPLFEDNSELNRYNEEMDDELCGMYNHGYGLYKSKQK